MKLWWMRFRVLEPIDGDGDGGGGAGLAGIGEQLGDDGGQGGDPKPPTPGTETVPEWATGYQDPDVRGWIAKQTGTAKWQGPEDMVKAHMGLLKMRGVPGDKLIAMEPIENRDAWHGENGIYARLGRPASADNYEMPSLTVNGNDIASELRNGAFELGLSQAQASGIAERVAAAEARAHEQRETEFLAKQQAETQDVVKEWGPKARENYMLAVQGAKLMGFDISTPEGKDKMGRLEREVGTKVALEMAYRMGSILAEPGHGDPPGSEDMTGDGFGMTAEQAQQQISDWEQANPKLASDWANGKPIDPKVRKHLESLYALAYPGRQR